MYFLINTKSDLFVVLYFSWYTKSINIITCNIHKLLWGCLLEIRYSVEERQQEARAYIESVQQTKLGSEARVARAIGLRYSLYQDFILQLMLPTEFFST